MGKVAQGQSKPQPPGVPTPEWCGECKLMQYEAFSHPYKCQCACHGGVGAGSEAGLREAAQRYFDISEQWPVREFIDAQPQAEQELLEAAEELRAALQNPEVKR